ncbi:hypothetical protein RUW00_17200 [Bacillus sp. IS1]|uniref:hypothetical protein n=1 Tax=Bacillus TaxID=1386 RepID=UPI0028F797C1|nr:MULTISPECIES: hypothetical protein [unclassified Bacillus (in: firmicutes)]MDU0077742.1 hypothetical protein [Bacillus sp. IG2]MDU0103009.1 hypothetical protein [Bacillus sp. IS1]
MTYGEIYMLFMARHPHLKPFYVDYRPHGHMSIIIWFKEGMALTIKYNQDNDVFELVKDAVPSS